MEIIADILLVGGALAATVYCIVLSRRLKRFTDLEKGVGGAIAVLSSQVDDMTKTLKVAQTSAVGSAASLQDLTSKAGSAARRLELLVASMHDLPEITDLPDEHPLGDGQPNPSNQAAPTIPLDPEPAKETGPLFQSQRGPTQEAAE